MKKTLFLSTLLFFVGIINLSAQQTVPELNLLPQKNNSPIIFRNDSTPKFFLVADSSKIHKHPNYHPSWMSAPLKSEIHWFALVNIDNESYWNNVYSDKLLIEFKKGIVISDEQVKKFIKKFSLNNIIGKSMFPDLQNFYEFKLSKNEKKNILRIIKAAKTKNFILYAEPLPIIKSEAFLPNDPQYYSTVNNPRGQWDMATIHVDSVWTYFQGGSSNWLAVIDNAVDYNQPDLYNTVWYGYDFANNDPDPYPDTSVDVHGTHVSGTVGATINNGIGIAGMTNDTIFFAKTSDGTQLVSSAILNAVNYISTVPQIKVINMSYTNKNAPTQAQLNAYATAWNSGKVLIAAAGNFNTSSIDTPVYPASFNAFVISVSAVGVNNTGYLDKASYSNFGPDIDISAPGGEPNTVWPIWSTLPDTSYGGSYGTSMAAPHVTGLAGIIAATNPFLTNTGIRSILETEVIDLGTVGYDQYFGYGMICAWCAFEQACNLFTISISANGPTTFCSGGNVTLTAPYNDNISYQWIRNGININGAINNTYVATQSGAYSLSALTAGNCFTTSNTINVNVNTTVIPSINITANPNGAICSGTNATFIATVTNGGTSPFYQWQVNGSNVGLNAGTFSSSSLTNGNVVNCALISNASCASPTNAISNAITMSVSSPVTPSINITANPSGVICSGTNVTFTASPTNGGTLPSYQWKKNGSNVGANSPTFSTSTLTNGNIITCVLTSNAPCATSTTATSNSITLSVNTTVPPTINITASPGATVCAGDNVSFTSAITNGGTLPTYQWKRNNNNIATTSSIASNSFANGDVIKCVLTSNSLCASPPTATSNSITMVVNPTITPIINITANPSSSVCLGTSVTYTASLGGGGSNPAYQWKVNGSNVGSNSATCVISNLNDGDMVNVALTSNASCASPSTVVSNTLMASVWSAINASAGNDTTITQGNSVTLIATGGVSYHWSTTETTQGISVSPGNTTTYTVTITNSHNCTASADVTVNVQPCSSIYTLSSPSEIVPASGGNCSTYLTTDADCPWSVNNGGCMGWVTSNNPSGIGSATVSFTVQPNTSSSPRNCYDTIAGKPFWIIQPAGPSNIQELSAVKNISVFPNPNNGTFILKAELTCKQDVKVNLYNSLGQIVCTKKLSENSTIIQTSFDLSGSSKGIYYVQLIAEGKYYYEKIVVE